MQEQYNLTSSSNHEEQLQRRCDQYFIQGHFQSAFTLVASRCDHFNYIEHINTLILQQISRLQQLQSNTDSFVNIQTSIQQILQTIQHLKAEIKSNQKTNEEQVEQLINSSILYQQKQQQLQNQQTSITLIKQLIQLLKDFQLISQTIQQHKELALLTDNVIEQINNLNNTESQQNSNQPKIVNINNQLAKCFEMAKQLKELNKIVVIINNIFCNVLPQLKQMNIENVSVLEQYILQFKTDIYQEIYQIIIKNWSESFRNVAYQIGQQMYELIEQNMFYDDEKNIQMCYQINKTIQDQFGVNYECDFSDTNEQQNNSFNGDLKQSRFAKQIQQKNAQKGGLQVINSKLQPTDSNRSQLMSLQQQLYFEIINNAELLQMRNEFLQSIQKSFRRVLINSLSVEQVLFQQKNNTYFNIIGMLSISEQMPGIFNEKDKEEYFLNLQNQLLKFSSDISKIDQLNRSRLLEAINKEVIADFDENNINQVKLEKFKQFHNKFISNFKQFIILLEQSQFNPFLVQIKQEVLQNIFSFYCTSICHAYAEHSFKPVYDAFAVQIHNIKQCQDDILSYQQSTIQSLQFNQKLFAEIGCFIRQIASYLGFFKTNQYVNNELITNIMSLLTTDIELLEFHDREILQAFNEIFYPCLQQEMSLLILAKELGLGQFLLACQAYFYLTHTLILTQKLMNNYFKINYSNFGVYVEINSNKFFQILDKPFESILSKTINNIYDGIDFQKRYVNSKQIDENVFQHLKALVNYLNTQMQYLPQQFKNVLLQKRLLNMFVEQFLRKLLQISGQFIKKDNVNLIIRDLEEIQQLSKNYNACQQIKKQELKELVATSSKYQSIKDVNNTISKRQATFQQQPSPQSIPTDGGDKFLTSAMQKKIQKKNFSKLNINTLPSNPQLIADTGVTKMNYDQIMQISRYLVIQEIYFYQSQHDFSYQQLQQRLTQQSQLIQNTQALINLLNQLFSNIIKQEYSTMDELTYGVFQKCKISSAEKQAWNMINKFVRKQENRK